MPDKEGSDDEKKSTKSVINKKQKQMMGEEGYDIARDQGRVRPSKDKKDATTLRKPPSKEMKKTQKVNKGPSAFERVKARYGKSVMNVGKKKVKEELDLTQVAEALGGYIVEARRGKRIPNASGGKKTGSLRGGDIEFPGDRTGATQQAKDDIEARKGFKKNKPGGLKDDERNPYVKREVRRSRVDDLGGDIFDQPKFTQKGFEKSLKDVKKAGKKGRDAQAQAFKDIKAAGGSLGQGGDIPVFDKKEPFEKPEDPFKTSKTPTGSLVKKFEFQPRDRSTQQASEKTAKSFKQFSRDLRRAGSNIQDYKDRDIATMRNGSNKRNKSDGTRDVSTMNPSEMERAFGAGGSTEGSAGVGGSGGGTGGGTGGGSSSGSSGSSDGIPYSKFSELAKKAASDVARLNKERDALKNKGNLGDKQKQKLRDLNKQIQGAQSMEKGYTAQSQGVGKGYPIVALSGNEPTGQNPRDKSGREKDFGAGKETSGRETRSGAYLRGLRGEEPPGKIKKQEQGKGGSLVKGNFAKIQKFMKANPTVAGLASYDLGKGILGKVYNKVSSMVNLPTPRAIRVSAKS